jgi:hypothetical protein
LAHTVVGLIVFAELAGVQALRQVGELIDHRLGLGPRHDRAQSSGVEDVAQDGLGAELAEHLKLPLGSGYRGHLVARCDQLRHK